MFDKDKSFSWQMGDFRKEFKMESNFIIATASTADLTKEYLAEHEIPFISYSYVVGEDSYEDKCDDNERQEVYKQMREGSVLTTAAINIYTYYEFFKGLLQTGKDVIFLDMSKAISSSFSYCEEALIQIKEEFPKQKIINVDTRCISGGLGLLVESAVALKEEGKSFDEVLDWIENNKLNIAHRFTVDDLKWLKMGGRVSNASALVGTLLSIKPVLYVPDDGSLVVVSKVRGRKSALASIVESMKNDIKDPANTVVQINHADCLADSESVRIKLLEIFPDIKEVRINNLGVVIGAHCGPGLIAIFYMTDGRIAK